MTYTGRHGDIAILNYSINRFKSLLNPAENETVNVNCLILKDFIGAVDVNRTHDLLITNQLLYQLSYNGIILAEGNYNRIYLLPLLFTLLNYVLVGLAANSFNNQQ